MNCCDYNCNQGKDCPARKGYAHRKVKAGTLPEDLDVPIQFWEEPDQPPIWPEVAAVAGLVVTAFAIIAVTAWGWL
jgi:hypothetical protein